MSNASFLFVHNGSFVGLSREQIEKLSLSLAFASAGIPNEFDIEVCGSGSANFDISSMFFSDVGGGIEEAVIRDAMDNLWVKNGKSVCEHCSPSVVFAMLEANSLPADFSCLSKDEGALCGRDDRGRLYVFAGAIVMFEPGIDEEAVEEVVALIVKDNGVEITTLCLDSAKVCERDRFVFVSL